jgi:hypothetical protein
MKVAKAIWNVYIKMLHSIFMSGHADKDGRIYSGHSVRMNYELVYFMAFGAFLPSLPLVLAIKEISFFIGFQYWFLLGFVVYFMLSIAIGMSIKKLVDAAPKSSMLTSC